MEPADKQALPVQVHVKGSRFRRLTHNKTPQQVRKLLGTIALRGLGYKAALADGGPVLFPNFGLLRELYTVLTREPPLSTRQASIQHRANQGDMCTASKRPSDIEQRALGGDGPVQRGAEKIPLQVGQLVQLELVQSAAIEPGRC